MALMQINRQIDRFCGVSSREACSSLQLIHPCYMQQDGGGDVTGRLDYRRAASKWVLDLPLLN